MLLNYIDFIWLPVGLFVVHKEQRLVTAAFFIACFIMMRLQIEMMHAIGFPTGILPLIKYPVEITGMVVYMVFYIFFMAMAYWSPRTQKHIFLAASISIFFAAMTASMVIMLL